MVYIFIASSFGCDNKEQNIKKDDYLVYVQKVKSESYSQKISLTGEIRARVQSQLSFSVTGRIIERLVDIGSHVNVGDVLARLNSVQQVSEVASAEAGVKASEAQLLKESLLFKRQQQLLVNGSITRSEYDQSEAQFESAKSNNKIAIANLEEARKNVSDTVLRAINNGLITARNAEVGEVVQPAQSIFTLAHDGPRDVVFQLQESLIGTYRYRVNEKVQISLIENPQLKVDGYIREVSPIVEIKTGGVRIKVAIDKFPFYVKLGDPVIVTVNLSPIKVIKIPWKAIDYVNEKPAVWIVDPKTRAISLMPIVVSSYDNNDVLVSGNLKEGQLVVVEGVQFLQSGQVVSFTEKKS
ncbi:hypothetical protein RL73_06775 [Liberibacter crescens]|nr:hypothetical protein RL73_06775 [Liberibacter crescens]